MTEQQKSANAITTDMVDVEASTKEAAAAAEQDPGWRWVGYGRAGMAETMLKSAAYVTALVGFIVTMSEGVSEYRLEGYHVAQMVVCAVLTFMYAAAIVDRVLHKDKFAMIFIFVTIAGHLLMTLQYALVKWGGIYAVIWSSLLILGDSVKIFWLSTASFENAPRLKAMPRAVLVFGTAFFIALYGFVLGYEVYYYYFSGLQGPVDLST